MCERKKISLDDVEIFELNSLKHFPSLENMYMGTRYEPIVLWSIIGYLRIAIMTKL